MKLLAQESIAQAFATAIASAGMTPPANLIGDHRLRMFSPDGEGTPVDAWYVLRLDFYPAGAFGCKRKGLTLAWNPGCVKPTFTDQRARELSCLQAQLNAFSSGIVSASARHDCEILMRYAMQMLRIAERMVELGAQAGLDDPLAGEEANGTN